MRCKDCCYYDAEEYTDLLGSTKEKRGICRRLPPVGTTFPVGHVFSRRFKFFKWEKFIYLLSNKTIPTMSLPSVRGDRDWCGEFKNTLCEEENPYFLDPTVD